MDETTDLIGDSNVTTPGLSDERIREMQADLADVFRNDAEDDFEPGSPLSFTRPECDHVGHTYFCPRCSRNGVCCTARPDPENRERMICAGGCNEQGKHPDEKAA